MLLYCHYISGVKWSYNYNDNNIVYRIYRYFWDNISYQQELFLWQAYELLHDMRRDWFDMKL